MNLRRALTTNVAMVLAAALLAGASPVTAAEVAVSPTDILFEKDHLGKTAKGERLVYRLQRSVSEPKLLGPSFSDDITLSVRDVTPEGARNVDVVVFTGDRQRDTRAIDGLTGNPVLVFYLDRAVSNFAMLGGGNKAYLKNQFRIALRSTAKVEAVKATYDGKEIDAYRVTVVPYAYDKNKAKMQGYENARFELVVSEAVPGHLVEMNQDFTNTQPTAPRLEERIALSRTEKAQ
ncbi:MAG: hypothetical protein NW205_04745 [Hyphomicrobiaceae bacterium]|nr:hypothetical protein [Hyphomicrobiaceae bacterium]